MDLIYEIFGKCKQQGPGSKSTTEEAFKLTGITDMNISALDIGCGTGRQTIDLANIGLKEITAIDNSALFTEILNKKGVEAITAETISMFDLPFDKDRFDLIWSEGAIYFLGFKKGLETLNKYLKKNGVIALSEVTYLEKDIPQPCREFWDKEYPEIGTVSQKIAAAEDCGYSYLASFKIPDDDWIENYYKPFFKVMDEHKRKYPDSQGVIDIEREMRSEYEFFMKYKRYYGYVFYIFKKY